MLLRNGHFDKGIRFAEEGNDKALTAQCCLYKAHVLMAAKVKEYN